MSMMKSAMTSRFRTIPTKQEYAAILRAEMKRKGVRVSHIREYGGMSRLTVKRVLVGQGSYQEIWRLQDIINKEQL
jgi:hypothetical protein